MKVDKPTITDFTNANHNHSSTATGGLAAMAIWTSFTGTYASASTFTFTGTDADGSAVNQSDTTDSVGFYSFTGITISDTSGYTITVSGATIPAGYLNTDFTISGSNILGTGATVSVDFGYVQSSTASGTVYYDANDNGAKDAGETTGINNVCVGFAAKASAPDVSNEVTIGNNEITATRLKGTVTANGVPLATTVEVDTAIDKKLAIKDKLIEKLEARLDALEEKLKKVK